MVDPPEVDFLPLPLLIFNGICSRHCQNMHGKGLTSNYTIFKNPITLSGNGIYPALPAAKQAEMQFPLAEARLAASGPALQQLLSITGVQNYDSTQLLAARRRAVIAHSVQNSRRGKALLQGGNLRAGDDDPLLHEITRELNPVEVREERRTPQFSHLLQHSTFALVATSQLCAYPSSTNLATTLPCRYTPLTLSPHLSLCFRR